MASRRALAQRRKAVGYSQERLAHLLEIHPTTVFRWEAGLTDPLPRQRPSLARALAVSIDELDRLLSAVTPGISALPDQPRPAQALRPTPQPPGRRADNNVGLSYLGDIPATVAALAELVRNDVQRRDFLRNAAFVAAASALPSRDWLLAILETIEPGRRSHHVDHEEVLAIRRTFSIFYQADVMHGGGHARHTLARYVTSEVLPRLDDADPNSDAGRELFNAASEQTYLLGWMAFDDGRHALAQRYLTQSLRLARASGDVALGSHVLAGMSAVARTSGHPREAIQLATTGRQGLHRTSSPTCLADLWATQARAHATLGEPDAAAHAIVESETAFETIRSEDEPAWARFIDRAYLAGDWAKTFVELNRPTEATHFAQQSLADAREQRRGRRAALSQSVLARAALARSDLHDALDNAHHTLTLTTQVRSSQCVEAVQDLQQRLQPYKAVPAVRDFNERARILLPARA